MDVQWFVDGYLVIMRTYEQPYGLIIGTGSQNGIMEPRQAVDGALVVVWREVEYIQFRSLPVNTRARESFHSSGKTETLEYIIIKNKKVY